MREMKPPNGAPESPGRPSRSPGPRQWPSSGLATEPGAGSGGGFGRDRRGRHVRRRATCAGSAQSHGRRRSRARRHRRGARHAARCRSRRAGVLAISGAVLFCAAEVADRSLDRGSAPRAPPWRPALEPRMDPRGRRRSAGPCRMQRFRSKASSPAAGRRARRRYRRRGRSRSDPDSPLVRNRVRAGW